MFHAHDLGQAALLYFLNEEKATHKLVCGIVVLFSLSSDKYMRTRPLPFAIPHTTNQINKYVHEINLQSHFY